MTDVPEFAVGVFEHPRKRGVLLTAYVRDYNPSWDGCCVHRVIATSGEGAKRVAMQAHRMDCMQPKAPSA